jgi:hypothetical protein
MKISNITWRGESIEDIEVLRELPVELTQILSEVNGFVIHEGVLHVRGACLTPEWHSLRVAWRGTKSICTLYPDVMPDDVPFAEDQVGDQFLLRHGTVIRLIAETGELEPMACGLEEFLVGVNADPAGYLNVALHHKLQPGQLLQAFPPFCLRAPGASTSLRPIPAGEVILFHADLARQIRDIPDGGQITLRVIE